jgi:general secretion pathway protein N
LKRIAAFAALGIASYAIVLIATLPASLAAERIAAASGGAVQVTDATGSLWCGTARARVVPHRGMPVEIEALAWRLRPARLFAGRLAFDVKLTAAGIDAGLEAARGFGGWEARELLARGDASGLAALSPYLGPMRPQGALTFTAPRLAWDGGELRGEALLEWRGASVGWSEVRPLGSYQARLNATQGPAQFAIVTLDGPLEVSGQGTLTLPSRIAITGEARADAAQYPALEPLLKLIGARRADGAHAIDWRFN